MQRKELARHSLDLLDSGNVEVLFGVPLYHAFQHAVHVANRRRQDVHTGGFDKLFCFRWR